MKRFPGMNVMRGMLLAPALMAAACGGEQSVASKSAAAYREAQAKGVPVSGGHAHDHGAATTSGGMDHSAHGAMSAGAAAMDHSAHGTGANAHAGMDHGAAAAGATDHSGHAAAGTVDHAAMGHGTAANAHAGHTATASNAHAQHGTAPATGGAHAGHSTTAGAATHDQHAGMQHGTASPATDPHAQHGTAGAPAIASAPRSNAEMQRVQPAATLRRDAFDAPAPVSVSEAAKATQGGGHEGHPMRGITPGQDRENPPTPMPATRDGSTPAAPPTPPHHGNHGAQNNG
jgi:hypothetical protein